MIFASAGNFGISFLLEILAIVPVVIIFRRVRFLGPMLSKAIASKRESIGAQLSAGDEARVGALRLVAERKTALDAAKVEAAEIIERAHKSAEFLVNDGTRRADEEYERIVGRIGQEIEATRSRARQEVLSELGVVVVVATEVVVRAELNTENHHRLIDEAISATESEPIDQESPGAVV